MGLFNFKRRESESIQEELNEIQATPVIPKEKFILETRIEKTELPIYEVYNQLKEDWETKGYTDAKSFPETSYRESNKRTIIERLSLLIKESMLKYEDKIAEMEILVEQSSKNGFVETLGKLKKQKDILDRHLKELHLLEKDVENVGAKTKVILTSYEMGFARGIASVGEDKVNHIMG